MSSDLTNVHPLSLSLFAFSSGVYDTEYLDYMRKFFSLLPQYGMTAFVSMHQDVWSRYCGGSGAPAWTLEVVGFDLHAIEHTGAAWLQGQRGGGHVVAEKSLWPCGYQKLTAATMAYISDFFYFILSQPNPFCSLALVSGLETYLLQSYL